MSKTTTLLLVVALFAAVAVNSVNSAAADVFSFTNSSFYKEKAAEKLVPQGDPSLADTASGQQLIAGKNSKTYYYVYQVATATDKDKPTKGGSITLNVRKVDVNKLAFAEGSSAVSVTGFKWDSSPEFVYGASVKNNITVLANLARDPSVDNILYDIYAYLIDLDKNEKTELTIASASRTDENTYTTVNLHEAHISGSLTVILYSTTAKTSTGSTQTYMLVTLKDGKLGTPTTVKTVTWTSGNALDSLSKFDGTGENVYIVFQATSDTGLATETVYHYLVSAKEIKAGPTPTAVINAQVTDTNDYEIEDFFGHSEGRWVAIYSNETTSGGVSSDNYVVKASNDTTFKVLRTYTADNTGKTGTSVSYYKHFGGLLALITDSTTSTDGTSRDQYTYSYQTYAGDFTAGTKTAFASISGKYVGRSGVGLYRLGDNKAVNVLARQTVTNSTANPVTYSQEGIHFGQLFQKSFGATLQSILAICSLVLATLFLF